MAIGLRLALFGAGLGALLGGGLALGAAVDPGPVRAEPAAGAAMAGHGEEPGGDARGHGAVAASGLALADGGLRLIPARTTAAAGRPSHYAFTIAGRDGRPVRAFDLEQSKRMHLIAVRRDLTGFRHVHPAMAADGTWRVTLPAAAPGAYRVFTDFSTRGTRRVLGADLLVPGQFRPRALPAPSEAASAGDGYRVRVRSRAGAGREGTLAFEVSRAGKPVALQPYLGAKGHLVALREGDLAYLHVHPEEQASAAPGMVAFAATYPSAGRYRLFLQFRAEGRVHTAPVTQEVTA